MGRLTTIQMYAAASGDAAATIDIPADGDLVGIDWAIGIGGADADADFADLEISFNSTSQRTTNDARAAISAAKSNISGARTAEANVNHINKYVHLPDGIGVLGGERIYLHINLDTGVTVVALVVLYFKFRTVRRAATRRR